MNTNLIIYSLKSKFYQVRTEIFVIFDSHENATYFMHRFRATRSLKISKYYFNSDDTEEAYGGRYCVVLHKTSQQSHDLVFYDLICTALMVEIDEYRLEFEPVDPGKHNTLELILFARNQCEAIKEAIVVRDAIIRSGDWRMAYLKLKDRKLKPMFKNIMQQA